VDGESHAPFADRRFVRNQRSARRGSNY